MVFIRKSVLGLMLFCSISVSADTFFVTNTDDAGVGSLRHAIELANLFPDQDTIRFAIPGIGVHTIQPLTALPFVMAPVDIDASQPGGSPGIELDGSLAAPGPLSGGHTSSV